MSTLDAVNSEGIADLPTRPMSPVLAWLRLIRVALFPTAVADILAGSVLAAGRFPEWPRLLFAIGGSLCVYHGGLVLNDWADCMHDRATRPDRPLPAKLVSMRAALIAAWVLLFAGPVLGLCAAGSMDLGVLAYRGPAFALGLAALGAVVYDLWGRGPWSGPFLLGFCRAANLGAGVCVGLGTFGRDLPKTTLFAAVLGYGAYVFAVSRLGRLEDGEETVEPAPETKFDEPGREHPTGDRLGRLPSHRLLIIATLLAGAGLLGFLCGPIQWPGPWPGLALALFGAFGLVRLALQTKTWTRPLVARSMGACLRRLLLFTAALAFHAGFPHGAWCAALILCGYPISHSLRNRFPVS